MLNLLFVPKAWDDIGWWAKNIHTPRKHLQNPIYRFGTTRVAQGKLQRILESPYKPGAQNSL
jgi:hypothetical protein